jgi:AcrR family transcriptional regulator
VFLTNTRGLRDAHKTRVRRALREAALKLFAERGFDSTTAEEVASQACVSVRTFFRYFPTKESVLFLGERKWTESFIELYRDQLSSRSDLEAMCTALVELASNLPFSRRSLLMYERIVATSPTLRGREQDQQEESAVMMAAAIAARRGLQRADEACHMLASIGVLMYRLSLDTWLAGPASIPRSEVIVEKFRLLATQLMPAEATASPGRGTYPPRRAGPSLKRLQQPGNQQDRVTTS